MGNRKKGNKRGRPPVHGGFSFLARLELPENMAHVKRYLSDMREGLIQDHGPNEDGLSKSQIVIIDRAISKAGVLRCMEEYCRKEGVMKGGSLTHCLRASYLSYSNSLRLDLTALKDLGKKADQGLSPFEVAAEIDREKEKAENRSRMTQEPRSQAKPGEDKDK